MCLKKCEKIALSKLVIKIWKVVSVCNCYSFVHLLSVPLYLISYSSISKSDKQRFYRLLS